MTIHREGTDAAVPIVQEEKLEVVASPTPMSIIQMAVAKGADISQLEKLMALQERYEDRQAKKAYDAALAQFKAKNVKIVKDSKVDYQNSKRQRVFYKYAGLDQVLEQTTPSLSEVGLNLSFRIDNQTNSITVTAVLAHELGHSESTSVNAGADTSGSKNSLQAIGSTITYLQRYTALSILGLTAGTDDDGNLGGNIEDERKFKPANDQPEPQQDRPEEPDPMEEKREAYLKNCMKKADKYFDLGLDALVAGRESKNYQEALAWLDEKRRARLIKHVADIENELMRAMETTDKQGETE